MSSLLSELSASGFGFLEGSPWGFFGGRVGSGFFGLLGLGASGSLCGEVGRFWCSSKSSLLIGVIDPLGITPSLMSSGRMSTGPWDDSYNRVLVIKVATILNSAFLFF